MVGVKLKYVLIPRRGGEEETLKELRKWDLWGPLFLCLMLSVYVFTYMRVYSDPCPRLIRFKRRDTYVSDVALLV